MIAGRLHHTHLCWPANRLHERSATSPLLPPCRLLPAAEPLLLCCGLCRPYASCTGGVSPTHTHHWSHHSLLQALTLCAVQVISTELNLVVGELLQKLLFWQERAKSLTPLKAHKRLLSGLRCACMPAAWEACSCHAFMCLR